MKRLHRLPLIFLPLNLLISPLSGGAELPAKPLFGLAGIRFSDREKAQDELLEWARKQPIIPVEVFLDHSRKSPDPEVRERCRAILLLLLEDEYLRVGEAYLGVNMQDEMALLPGHEKRSPAVRVVRVEQGSPADRSGFKANDLIVALAEGGVSGIGGLAELQENIRARVPGTKIALEVLRDGKLRRIHVVLGRLEPGSAGVAADGTRLEPHEAIREAQARYSRRWMEKRKLPTE